MSVIVCIHICIGNNYIETVTCNYIHFVFVAVRFNHLEHKSFIYEKDVIIDFPYMARTRKAIEKSEVIKDNLKIIKINVTNKQFMCYFLSLNVCLRYFRTGLS
jgi:hypothetical protein